MHKRVPETRQHPPSRGTGQSPTDGVYRATASPTGIRSFPCTAT